MQKRIIPTLLLRDFDFVKSFSFKDYMYLGDPLNIIKILNEKFIDELVILNISKGNCSNFDFLSDIYSEAFVPISYGGALNDLDTIEKLLSLGIERVVLNAEKFFQQNFISESVKCFGSSTICAKIDVGSTYRHSILITQLSERIVWCADQGVSEIIIQSTDRDGSRLGLDRELLKVANRHKDEISIVLSGGLGDLSELTDPIWSELGGVSASSLFSFAPGSTSVLINNPGVDYSEVDHEQCMP